MFSLGTRDASVKLHRIGQFDFGCHTVKIGEEEIRRVRHVGGNERSRPDIIRGDTPSYTGEDLRVGHLTGGAVTIHVLTHVYYVSELKNLSV